ncbi:MAG: cytochrome c-type biogenesis CcmF C-terminal domain-containing protein [Pseudomonadota bacterium]
MLGSLSLFALRASELESRSAFSVVSRESALVLNNILLAVSAFVVFIGTIWPLIAELAFDRRVSVGPPFFDAAFTPFMIGLAIVLPLGALLPWKRAKLDKAARPLWPILAFAFAIAALVWAIQSERSALAPLCAALGAWLVLGAITDLLQRAGRGAWPDRLRRIGRLPRADQGKSIAHAGFGITIFGIGALIAWEVQDVRVVQVGDRYDVGSYTVELTDVRRIQGPNYISTMADMTVSKNGTVLAVLNPEKRFYPVAAMPTTEAAIANGVFRDIYVVIGDPQPGGGWAVRAFVKPFANWIWAGAIIMSLGGVFSLSDRRLRVGAGARRKAAVEVPAQ